MLGYTRVFLGIFFRCANIAEFRGIQDNSVIPWNFEIPVPVQTDPVEMFAIQITSRVLFESPIPCKLLPRSLSKSREIRAPSRRNP